MKTLPATLLITLLLELLALQAAARSLGSDNSIKNNNTKRDETTVHIHKLKSIADVTISSSRNLNRHNYISLGRMPRHHNTRALLQFEPVPTTCKYVAKAELFLYYYRAYMWHPHYNRLPFKPKIIEARQLFAPWNENEATWSYRSAGEKWKKSGLEFNNTDAAEKAEEEKYTIKEYTEPGFIKLDVTPATQRWTATDNDFGFLLSLSDENLYGRQIHFYSREAMDQNGVEVKPYMKVTCWSDFCAPNSQRRAEKQDQSEDQERDQPSESIRAPPQKLTPGSRGSRLMGSGSSSFHLPANSYQT